MRLFYFVLCDSKPNGIIVDRRGLLSLMLRDRKNMRIIEIHPMMHELMQDVLTELNQ